MFQDDSSYNLKSNIKNENYQIYSIWDYEYRDHLGISKIPIKGSCPIGIPLQCIIRFSKPDELILDPFCGSGTTLLASAYLERYGLGVEINPVIFSIAKKNLEDGKSIPSLSDWIYKQKLVNSDSLSLMKNFLNEDCVDLVFAHPPYWNLIDYSKYYSYIKDDISTEENFNSFLNKIDLMFQGIRKVLKKDRFACILIGDVFIQRGRSIPLDYYFTKIALENDFDFYSKIIKVTRNAFSRKNRLKYWEKRSIEENLFICIHDYLIIFQNKKRG